MPKWINDSLKEAIEAFSLKINGFNCDDAILTIPETRSSSPIQIKRNEKYLATKYIYPIGEGAGFSGGIMTTAIDGIKCALKVIEDEEVYIEFGSDISPYIIKPIEKLENEYVYMILPIRLK